MRRQLCLCALLPFVLAGCAAFAVRPPTPAKVLDVRGLKRPGPGENYYVMIFSSENVLRQARYTHTWVTVVHVVDQQPGKPPLIEHHTISWMPATLDILPWRLSVEPGVNLDLHTTMADVALANNERIALWGPYECRPSLYTRLLVQKQFMESGRIGYQCIDNVGEAARKGNGCDCIHAVTDMDPEHGRREYPVIRYGFSAGLEITRRFRELDGLLDPDRTHDFLIPTLGLNVYPIIRGNDNIWSPTRAPVIGKR